MKANGEPNARLQSLDPHCVRLVQVTDSHIFESAEASLYGMNTRDSFRAVMAAVRAAGDRLDLLLATGDLAQDGSAGAYRFLADRIADFGKPTFWLPGNHDDADTMRRNFVGENIHAEKLVLIGGWVIILLDSTIPGEVHGSVADEQMEFMDRALCRHSGRHALVCLHHQARESGSAWIDGKGLRDAERLRRRLAAHANLRAVIWGHVHQEARQSVDGVEWMSSPSSCVQFKPGSREFALGDEKPGCRYLGLNADGSIETSVVRVDFDARG